MSTVLRCGLFELERRNELLDVLHLEQTALVLVVGPSCVGSTALGRLAVAEIQESRLLGGSMSSESEHASVLQMLCGVPPRLDYLSLRNIGEGNATPNPPPR
jgi:hypothetical protein